MIKDYTLFSVALPPPNTTFNAVFCDESGYFNAPLYRDKDGRFFKDDEEIKDFESWAFETGLIGWVKDD